jgi:hypothetical protein
MSTLFQDGGFHEGRRQSTGPFTPVDDGRQQFDRVVFRASSCVNQALNLGASRREPQGGVNQQVGLHRSSLDI